MMKQSVLLAAVACLASAGVASAQNEPAQDTMRAPTGVESTAPNNPPIGSVPEATTDSPRAPAPQTSGQAPNMSKRMGAENGQCGGPESAHQTENQRHGAQICQSFFNLTNGETVRDKRGTDCTTVEEAKAF